MPRPVPALYLAPESNRGGFAKVKARRKVPISNEFITLCPSTARFARARSDIEVVDVIGSGCHRIDHSENLGSVD